MSQHDEDDLHEGISIKGYPSNEGRDAYEGRGVQEGRDITLV